MVHFQLLKLFPGLMMKLLVKSVKAPVIIFEPNNATIQATGTVTAYAIQPNATLSPLFVLNLVGDTTAKMRSDDDVVVTTNTVPIGHQRQRSSLS